MFNPYARSAKGQRAYAPKPKKKGKNLTTLGVITLTVGWLAGFSFEGAITGDVFLWFIEEVLVPHLWPGAVVVMDNLPAHKVEGVREAITAVGADVIYLPRVLTLCSKFISFMSCWRNRLIQAEQ